MGKLMIKKEQQGSKGATILGPGDFPLGSLESRAAARLRLLGGSTKGKGSPSCICFPDDEQPFFQLWEESELAAKIQCPLHGARFEPRCHIYVAKWRWENEVTCRWPRLSAQFHKAWKASFPPEVVETQKLRGRKQIPEVYELNPSLPAG